MKRMDGGWLRVVTAIQVTEDQGLSHDIGCGHSEEVGVKEQPSSNRQCHISNKYTLGE